MLKNNQIKFFLLKKYKSDAVLLYQKPDILLEHFFSTLNGSYVSHYQPYKGDQLSEEEEILVRSARKLDVGSYMIVRILSQPN